MTTMFDKQPDGDPHSECAAEIEALRQVLDAALMIVVELGGEVRQPELDDAVRLRKDAERYRWLAKRLIAYDMFSYRIEAERGPAIIFDWPKGVQLKFGDIGGSIDDAMAIEVNTKEQR